MASRVRLATLAAALCARSPTSASVPRPAPSSASLTASAGSLTARPLIQAHVLLMSPDHTLFFFFFSLVARRCQHAASGSSNK